MMDALKKNAIAGAGLMTDPVIADNHPLWPMANVRSARTSAASRIALASAVAFVPR